MANDIEGLDRPEEYIEEVAPQNTIPVPIVNKPFYKNPLVLGIGGVAIIGAIAIFIFFSQPSKNVNSTDTETSGNVSMVPTFGGQQEASDIENQLAENESSNITSQQNQIKTLQDQVTDQQSETGKANDEITELKAQLAAIAQNKGSANSSAVPLQQNAWVQGPHPASPIGGAGGESQGSMQQISPTQDFELSYNTATPTPDEQFAQYVPAGTFVQAVLLGGADADAGTNSQGDTTPILFRLVDQGTEPNFKKAHLRNCVITAQTYGDISSDRAMVRLDRLSCNYPDGSILDIPVYGTAYDIGGKNGIRGIEVLKNGPILMMSGVSGFLQGFGNALQSAETTQTPNIAGTTSTTVAPGSSLQYAAYGGAGTAMNSLASYYIALANLYHPIIQINAGAMVDIIFTQGFSTNPTQTNLAPKTSANTQTNPYGFTSPPQTRAWQIPTNSSSEPQENLGAAVNPYQLQQNISQEGGQ